MEDPDPPQLPKPETETLVNLMSGLALPSNFTGQATSLKLEDTHRRWLAVGLALHNVISPVLRTFIDKELQILYNQLKASHNVDNQTFRAHVGKYPVIKVPGQYQTNLHYENINGNLQNVGKKNTHMYDYNIASHVDFAKLFLQYFMAHFNAFDEECDSSALLGLLVQVDGFAANIKAAAKQTKDTIRNAWAHCNFQDWDVAKLKDSFQTMEQLIRSLQLPQPEEIEALKQLSDWKKNGLAFFEGAVVQDQLLQCLRDDTCKLADYVLHSQAFQEDESKRLHDAFDLVHKSLTGAIQRIDKLEKTVPVLQDRITNLECNVQLEAKNVGDFNAPEKNSYFAGRTLELETLLSGQSKEQKGQHKYMVVCGLGGCGKTTLAIEFAWRAWEQKKYQGGVFWMSAENDQIFAKSIVDLALNAHIYKKDESIEETLCNILQWLEHIPKPWLMIVDNLDQFEISQMMKKVLHFRWEMKSKGHILVTTRRSEEETREGLGLMEAKWITLSCWTVHDAEKFIQNRIHKDKDEHVTELAKELVGLPLAIEQACAYIVATKCSVEQYMQLYMMTNRPHLLGKRCAKGHSRHANRERLTIQTTWQMNLDYCYKDPNLSSSSQNAVKEFINTAAYLYPDEIPEYLLNPGTPNVLDLDMVDTFSDPLAAKEVIATLVKFSLFQRVSDTSFSVHRLVQEVLKSQHTPDQEQKYLTHAFRMIMKAFDVSTTLKNQEDKLFENAQTLLDHGKLGIAMDAQLDLKMTSNVEWHISQRVNIFLKTIKELYTTGT